ncbi:MAG: quinohemoprotein ethanol dehydrogenase [Verrucomicrobiota bacterium]|jgi:outer membrane protein assembly factor BamB
MPATPNSSTNWWTFHRDPAHSGNANGSKITSANVGKSLKLLRTVALRGSVMSTPAIVDGYVYVGTANSHDAVGANGGSFFKINLETGDLKQFTWNISRPEGDAHGFTGMGCTPTIAGGKIYFSAFNGKVYCLDQETLAPVWITDLRYSDPLHNQPVTNVLGADAAPQVEGWCSPLVVNGKVYVGIGEGENPSAYSFIYCLDAQSGNVVWIFCVCQFQQGQDNQPNVLPSEVVNAGTLPKPFSVFNGLPLVNGCSVWAAIAYDEGLNRLYCSTGNPQPDAPLPLAAAQPISPPPPTPQGYSYGILALDASSGAFKGFRQFPPGSSYRPSDTDIDVGGSATLFTRQGKRVLGIGCKNGAYMILDADTLDVIVWRQMLPYYNNGSWIPTVDPHGDDVASNPNPRRTNEESNATPPGNDPNYTTENYSGTYSTAAVDPASGRLFIGIGGNNYHFVASGIDYTTTPFLRALDWNTLKDAWPTDSNDPPRYAKAMPPMYTTAAESGISVPAVVNDVVFMATTKVSLYAFAVKDGTLLWQDDLGMPTQGYCGGYGYCMGPAIWQDYVVAGALVFGRDGGLLNIYKLQ